MESYDETFAAVYDHLFGGYAEKAASLLLRFYGSHAPASPLPKVLDLGCGTGQAVHRFLEAGYPVTGMDLSLYMLAIAQGRCRRFETAGRVEWIKGDFSHFDLSGPFGLAFSTYNSLNHLDSEERLRSCFRSVRSCLAPGGFFIFDYHSLKGLREWMDREEGQLPDGKVEISRSFDTKAGRGLMGIQGIWMGQPFEARVENWSFALEKVRRWLMEEGFSKVVLSDWQALPNPIQDPEAESRVVFLCSALQI